MVCLDIESAEVQARSVENREMEPREAEEGTEVHCKSSVYNLVIGTYLHPTKPPERANTSIIE